MSGLSTKKPANIILTVSILIIALASILTADKIVVDNVKDFKVFDWNSDGKPDVIIYFNDGRFGVMLNNSSNPSSLMFTDVIYFNKTDEITKSLKSLETDITAAAAVNQPAEPGIASQNSKLMMNKAELIKYINDESAVEDAALKQTKASAQNQQLDKIGGLQASATEQLKKEANAKKNESSEIIRQAQAAQSKKQSLTAETSGKSVKTKQSTAGNPAVSAARQSPDKKKTVIDSGNENAGIGETTPEQQPAAGAAYKYDVCLLNFLNESDIKFAADIEWLNSGIPELLMYEITGEGSEKIRIMSRESVKDVRMNDAAAFSNVKMIVTGSFKATDNDLIITVNINNKKTIKTFKVSGSKDNNGILSLISQTGKQLNEELRKNL